MTSNSALFAIRPSFDRAVQPAGPDYKTLQRLRLSCRVTLERYIDIAGQISGQLALLTPGSIDPVKRANLALLRQKEDKAHVVYLKAKAALLEYILADDNSTVPG
jgi:hypothetical protein